MNCKNCGKEFADGTKFCDQCGTKLEEEIVEEPKEAQEKPQEEPKQENTQVQSSQDTGSIGWGVLGFFVPIVGLVLFLLWRTERPKSAKAAGLGALISVIINFVVGFVLGILAVCGVVPVEWFEAEWFDFGFNIHL